MGYDVEQISSSFRLIHARRKAARDAVYAVMLSNPEYQRAFQGRIHPTSLLTDLLLRCGWETAEDADDTGDVIDLRLNGSRLNALQVDALVALAPYVDDGSTLVFRVEEGGQWRYRFSHGRVFEDRACVEITWPPGEQLYASV